MTACPGFEALILDRAAGELSPGSAAELDAHLATCAACRAAERDTREVLGLAALPPPSAEELSALAGLAPRLRAAWRRAEQRRVWIRRASTALLAAAATALLFLVPRSGPPEPSPAHPTAAAGGLAEEVEIWALSDPFGEALDESSPAANAGGDEASAELESQTVVDLFLNPGE